MKIGRFYPALLLAAMFAEKRNADDTLLLKAPLIEPFRGMYINSNSPIFFPKRTKFKGWMRENRKCSFNKKRYGR